MMTHSVKDWSVYFIAGSQDIPCNKALISIEKRQQNLLRVLEQALVAGISCFQFREKADTALSISSDILRLAEQCQQLCHDYHVPFIVNDDVDLSLTIGADGVHVGQSDQAIAEVIERCPDNMLVGLSVNNLAQAQISANNSAIDYFGVGPIFPTTSKSDAKPVVGLSLLKAIKQSGINKPLVAIGGIDADNANDVRVAGADSIAVISAIAQQTDIAGAVQRLKNHVAF